METVESAVTAYFRSDTAPNAYGIDFGVLANGETALVEANDGYSLGAYDIAADQRAIDTVLIAGTVTNVCSESSARDASTLGFRTIMVADANAARNDREHNATLHTIYRWFGDVRPTSGVLELLSTSLRQVDKH